MIASRVNKAVDMALDMVNAGMDMPLAIHKAADHCSLANSVVARAMGSRKRTKPKHTEPPVDAFWMR